ncbi:MAG TPA: histidine phosphatase family protein [Desulfobacterales bacterium]|nr:histidine phosphatase family protein [Desulfobacterales bacterium]
MTDGRTSFGVIRHARTEWNRDRRIQGWSDSPLTADGEHQAELWAAHLQASPWDAILASDTGRAQATARIINRRLGLPLHLEPRLRELDWGRWTGRTVRQLLGEEPDVVAAQERAGWDFRPPGGESRRDQLERSRRALLDAAAERPGSAILIVTHEGVIKSLAYFLKGDSAPPTERPEHHVYRLHRLSAAGGELRYDGVEALPTEDGWEAGRLGR